MTKKELTTLIINFMMPMKNQEVKDNHIKLMMKKKKHELKEIAKLGKLI